MLPAGPVRAALERITGSEPDLPEVDKFGMEPAFAGEIRPLLDSLFERWFRVRCEGTERVPAEGPALIVSNHAGLLPWDALMLAHAVTRAHGRTVRPLIEDHFFYFPYLGTLMNRLGAVRACPENAERLLREGHAVAVFPEGLQGTGKRYRDRYRIQRFGRGGSIRLALATGAPLIPAAVVGAEETHPILLRLPAPSLSGRLPFVPVTPTFPWLGPLGLLPLPVRWRIHFGEPLSLGEHEGSGRPDRVLVNRLNEELRQTIQGMVDDLNEGRPGFLG